MYMYTNTHTHTHTSLYKYTHMQVLSDTPAPPAAGAFDEPCPGLLLDPDRSSYPSPLTPQPCYSVCTLGVS